MVTLIIYEAGVRLEDGRYYKMFDSPNKKEVDDYLEILSTTTDSSMTVTLLQKTYELISTTPQIIK